MEFLEIVKQYVIHNLRSILLIASIILPLLFLAIWLPIRATRKKAASTPSSQSQSTAETPSEPEPEYDCYIGDCQTRIAKIEKVKKSVLEKAKKDFGTIGRQWNRDGKDVFWLYRENDVLKPVITSDTLEESPSKLFKALRRAAIEIVFNVDKDESALEKYGWWFAIGGVSLFAMLMVVLKR